MSDSASLPTQPAPAPPDPDPDPFLGAVIGERYRIIDRIGEGGMGAVYRVEHTLMKKVMALKLLHSNLGQMDEAVRRFEREAQSASRLSHPNIIAVTDFGRAASGELFLVMEYLPGQSLAAVLESGGRLEIPRAVSLVRQILGGLDHAHAQGVIHRDLKPANIMVMARADDPAAETVKLLDFGIAKMSALAGGAETSRPLTHGAMVFGTPSYMSPEQATAQDADARTDIYSCGVILYELLTGRKPFIADDLVKVMALQVTQSPPSFSSAAPGVRIPAALEAVVMRALEKDRARRFASAADFIKALDRLDTAGLGPLIDRLPAWTSWTGMRRVGVRAMSRLPWPVRRWVPLGAGALSVVVLLTVVPLVCSVTREGPAAPPPPPRPVEAALQTPLKRIEEAMAKNHLTEARVQLMQQMSQHPESARVRYLLGTLEFIEKDPAKGLEAYTEALRLDPGLRGDAALLFNARSALDDRRVSRQALDLLINQVGKPAGETLAELASRDKRPEFRQPARAACKVLGCQRKVDLVGSYTLDLTQGRTCEEKREAVKGLADTGDRRAIEPLKRAKRERGALGGLLGGGNDCIRKDIEAALKELGG